MENKKGSIISVTGQVVLSITPDTIRLELKYSKVFKSYELACQTAEMNLDVIGNVMEECGLERSLPKTTHFSIDKSYQSVYENGDYTGKQDFEGFRLTQNLQIEIGVDNSLLTRVIRELGTKVQDLELNLTYGIKDPRSYKLKLLECAVKDATEKAQVMATAAGCTLGQIESIHYDDSNHSIFSRKHSLPQGSLGNEIVCFETAELELNPDDIEATEKVVISWYIAGNN